MALSAVERHRRFRAAHPERAEQERVYARQWVAANRGRVRANEHKRRAADPDGYAAAALARDRARRAADPERYRAAGRARAGTNLKQRAAYRCGRYANIARVREMTYHAAKRRRARLAQVLSTLTAEQWEAILELAGGECIYCGAATNLSMDHLTPISRGGNHTAENVAPACLPCNLSKGAKTVAEFLAEKRS